MTLKIRSIDLIFMQACIPKLQWLSFGRRRRRWEQDPERALVFRLASRAMPKPMRDALWLLRPRDPHSATISGESPFFRHHPQRRPGAVVPG
jgi:hypothetical protein